MLEALRCLLDHVQNMKENDGKAHRKNLQLKFILALLSTACVFLATNHYYYFIPPQNDDATTTVGSLQAAAASSSLAAHRRGDVAGGGQREKRLSMNRHSSSNYLSEEQIQSIQLASTNLISLEYNDSYDVSDDSYHVSYGMEGALFLLSLYLLSTLKHIYSSFLTQ